MYRAKVETVDGWRVRAGGKWLTCIGNRSVRIGDSIWTDGRCVYGYDKQSLAPIVLIASKNNPSEELVLPIQMGNTFGYFENTLHILGTLPFDCKSIVNNKQQILFSSYAKQKFNSRRDRVLSANCDQAGNVFELRAIIDSEDDHYDKHITITKNNAVIRSIELERDHVIWCFIENSDNWAFVAYSVDYNETPSQAFVNYLWAAAAHDKADNESSGGEVYPLEVYYYALRDEWLRYYGDSDYGSYTYNGKMTFFDSKGQKIDFISFDSSVSRDWIGNREFYFNADHIDSHTISYDGMSNIKFPMHDGYYFTIKNPILPHRDIIGFPLFIEKTVFTSDGQKLFSGYVQIQDDFLACKIKNNAHLIVNFSYSLPPTLISIATLEGQTALTKQLGAYDYHPYGSSFWATFDEDNWLIESTELTQIAAQVNNNRNATFLIETNGSSTKQDWHHIGYTLRPTDKQKFLKWFRQQQAGE